jgi:hypothetical protein
MKMDIVMGPPEVLVDPSVGINKLAKSASHIDAI